MEIPIPEKTVFILRQGPGSNAMIYRMSYKYAHGVLMYIGLLCLPSNL